MARKRKGRDISGWLVVDKPAGVTSTMVVNKVRWCFDAKKAGHAGTLDPAATGVLAVALGEATKTVPFITEALKAYRFTVQLGQATNTDDAEGEVTRTSDLRPTDEEIAAALRSFEGDIEQVPPQFSAVKVDGERAYKRARRDEDVKIEPRQVEILDLRLIDIPDADHADFEMRCGKRRSLTGQTPLDQSTITNAMLAFVNSEPHKKAIHRIMEFAGTGSCFSEFVSDSPPDWEVAETQLLKPTKYFVPSGIGDRRYR